MSDPVNPAAPDATAPAHSAPAPAAPPAQTAAPVAPQPPRVNPWALRPAPAAKAAPAPGDAPSQPAPVNAVPASQPAPDPRVDALMAVLGETVTQDLAALPANVQSAVKAIAGDDPVAQRRAINAMRANGIADTSRAAVPLPANTTPGVAQPAPQPAPASSAAADAAIAAQHAKLQGVAPIRALLFRQQNAEALARHAKTLAS